MDPNQKFTILSFVGGGIRGLMSATVLQRLGDQTKKLLDQTTMLAGCSTGSIITSELLMKTTPQALIDLFTGDEITFYNNMNPKPDAPAYPIDKVLASQGDLQKTNLVSGTPKNVLFVSFNVGRIEAGSDGRVVPKPWDPIMFTDMLGTDADKANGLDGNGNTLVAIAASSSGAMPGQLGSVEGNVDGAFFNHDPTLAAICLAVHNGVPLENIVAITIGTGLMPDWLASDTTNWGAKQWMNGDANPFDNTPPFLMNQTQPSPILDMCLSGTSANMMPRLCKMLLGDRYVNINPRLPCFIPENSTNKQATDLLQWHGKNGDPENVEKAIALINKYWPTSSPPIKPVVTGPTIPVVPPKPPVTGPDGTPGHGAFFFIQHKESKKVLDIANASPSAGAQVILYGKKPNPGDQANQKWQFVPAVDAPGWWYLQTAMSTEMVLTLGVGLANANPPITVQKKTDELRSRQLWNLVSTEDLGWWFIQCKAQTEEVKYTNPNSFVPCVIGVGSNGGADPIAVSTSLDYFADGPMSWGFLEMPYTG
ncbi:patatin-like phospholipase family protein [Variovorax sp. LT1R20]|uniref:patatin-like phospholipase family protein n=1 Tax=Variovorax sp. LT1R20 TaxID=3443729 RepID=UPI003F46E93C